MDPGFFDEPDPDFKNPDPSVVCYDVLWLGFGGLWPKKDPSLLESAKYDISLTFRYSFFRFFTDTDPDFPDTDFPDTDPDFPNPIPDLFAGPDPDSGKKKSDPDPDNV